MIEEEWPPKKISLTKGKRVLFLTKDLDLISKQLYDGLNLKMEDLSIDDLLDDINTDVMTPAWGWAFLTLDASAGSGNIETVSANLDDGNYALWIWANAGSNESYTFTVTTIDGTETFTGIVEGSSWNLWFTKSGNNYTYFEEDPS